MRETQYCILYLAGHGLLAHMRAYMTDVTWLNEQYQVIKASMRTAFMKFIKLFPVVYIPLALPSI